MKRIALVVLSMLLACATPAPVPTTTVPPPASAPARAAAPEAAAPVAKRVPVTTELHGQERVDEYGWLRKKGEPDVEAYLAAENAYSEHWLERTKPLEATLYAELLSRVQETDTSVVTPMRGYGYYSRSEKGKQYDIECRKKLPDGPEEVLLDVNELGKAEKFIELGAWAVSDDNALLAYTVDLTGFRVYRLAVKNLKTGQTLPDTADKVTSVAWAADNKSLFYTVEDDAKRSWRAYRHTLGSVASKDVLVFEEKDEHFQVGVSRSRSLRYLSVDLHSHTTSESWVLDAKTPAAAFKVVLPRQHDVEYSVDDRGDSFFIVTNDKGRTKRLVQVPLANPVKGRWVELVPVRPEVMLEGVDVFKDFYVLSERANGLRRLRSIDFLSKKETAFSLPEDDYFLSPAGNAEADTQEYRYGYMSMVTPFSTLARDMKTGQTRVLKVEPVPGYDASKYETHRLFATARDGTRLPISIAAKKGTPRDGSAPLYLRGYGSYGAPMEAYFSSAAVSLLDRGMVVAWAHVRGGGEFGKPWHDAGRMMNKRNTFTDFIDTAEYLVSEKWTRPDRLAINGASAGGLLMGAVLNMRPELFKVALVEVPFVDVVNTMLDETLPLTVGEFEEWGNPKEKAAYDYLMSYSPYDNVRAQAYPSMLVRSSYNDSQVLYHEPAKWVARLRALKTDQHPLLLKMQMDPAGHGGRSGRYDELHDYAALQAFVLWELGYRK